jgi:hypothetical protein
VLELPPIKEIGQLERVFARPSWADPSFMVYSSEFTFDVYTFASTAVELVLAPDPKRWAVGFTLPTTILATPRIAPHNNPTDFGEDVLVGLTRTFFTIFSHGPIVCGEWYGVSGIGQTMGIYTVVVSQ